MGRKIPAKKHRGVKDPLVQQAKRLESLKGKIDAPPRDPDEQPVPKSLLRLFGAPAVARRERQPRGALAGPAATARGRGATPGGAGNPVAKLQRLPGESVRSFSKRITGATRALHTAEDPHYYPSQVDEEEEYERPARRRRGAGDPPPRETKAQRRKQKVMLKKQEAEKERSVEAASRLVYERVQFGEQSHAPPALPAPRLPPALRALRDRAPRPGRRQLLLSGMLASGAQSGAPGSAAGELSAQRQAAAAETRRLAAVAAYRALKKQQRAATEPAHR
ncbi:hypothetical protein O0L34_g18042 [Tuta absoluta]|nr:hypothetical protein O0L34_g18042 [Tuta absoluta]